MRWMLVTLGAVMLLMGPADELLHDHPIGHADSDCVACHNDRTPLEIWSSDLASAAVPLGAVDPEAPVLQLFPALEPLTVAPKNSPPAGA